MGRAPCTAATGPAILLQYGQASYLARLKFHSWPKARLQVLKLAL